MPDVSRDDFKGALLPFFMLGGVVYWMITKVSYNSLKDFAIAPVLSGSTISAKLAELGWLEKMAQIRLSFSATYA